MAEKKDFYQVLGVGRNASDDELKKAFRQQAKTCHPDLHPDDKEAEQRFKEINEAYGILSDKDKRQRYDQFGHAGIDPSYGAGHNGGYGSGDFGDIFGDIFGDLFGGGRSRRQNPNAPVRGKDISINLTVDFKEAVFGCKRKIRYKRDEVCTSCKGSGSVSGARQTCPVCGGTGQVKTQQRTFLGNFTSVAPCHGCGGTGSVV